MECSNQFRGIKSASLAGRYFKKGCRTGLPGWESIPGLHKRSTNTGSVIHAPTLEPVYFGETILATWMSRSMENTIYLWFMLIKNTLGFLSVACASGFQVCVKTHRQKVITIKVGKLAGVFHLLNIMYESYRPSIFICITLLSNFSTDSKSTSIFGFFDVHIEFLWNIFPRSCEHFLQTFEANRARKG